MSARSLSLKKRLRAGETTYGGWLTVANPVIAEIMAGTGFDWVVIDTEHGGFGKAYDQPHRLQRLVDGADRAGPLERCGPDQADPRHGR
jgi:2-keto-3-deoxy-L-rhamnonate aldolase RhmA